jgi:P-type Ca2+ transporter type 2C
MTTRDIPKTKWYTKKVPEVCQQLETTVDDGLTTEEAEERLTKYGFNEIEKNKQISYFKLYFIQFKNPMLIILLIGAVLSFIGGHLLDSIVIALLVIINATISFIQERSAQKSIESLQQMSAPQATVLRNSKWTAVDAKIIVPGDIVKISSGDIVVADIRLSNTNNLQIDESALTGESEPVEKDTEQILKNDVSIGDRINMGFMGTITTAGNGIGIVVKTGKETEVGHIAELIQETEVNKTPMQKRIEALSQTLIGVSISAVAIVIGIGIIIGDNWLEMLQTGISLSVAAIPEGLPTIVTIVLTVGAKRMVKNKALTRQLASVETLGSTTVICSDKTGTLTQNQMQVVTYWSGGKTWDITGKGFSPEGNFIDSSGNIVDPSKSKRLTYGLQISALCNNSILKKKEDVYHIHGSPTEGALLVVAAKAGITNELLTKKGYKFIKSFPFDSNRKMSSSIIETPEGEYWLLALGAPDVLLKRSSKAYWNGKQSKLNKLKKEIVKNAIEEFASRALRTLSVAYCKVEHSDLKHPQEHHEQGLTFLAIHGIIDPPRKEVVESIDKCREAGIKTVMITGDYKTTAREIAKQIGIIQSNDELVLTGSEINKLNDLKLASVVNKTSVFARVSPEHKQRIVRAYQAKGHIAAMTGDGVNDAPALKNADIGISMGISGTQVAKDSSDLILLDDNFTTIVTAVRHGRRIYDNFKKYLREALTANIAEVSAILFAFILMYDCPIVPLTAIMILWINLFSDALPSLMLGWEIDEPDLMKRKPRLSTESFFADGLASKITIRGLVNGFLVYLLFALSYKRGYDVKYAQTLAFLGIIFVQNFHILDSRTFTSIYRRNPFKNMKLICAIILTSVISILFIYLPFGNILLGTVPVSLKHLIMVISISALPTFVLSGIKEIFNLKWL